MSEGDEEDEEDEEDDGLMIVSRACGGRRSNRSNVVSQTVEEEILPQISNGPRQA